MTDLPYELYECCSCEYIDLRSSKDLSGASGITVRFHPQLSTRPIPQWRRDLPHVFTPVLDEVYAALSAESRILGFIGARTVLGILLEEKAPDVATFKGQLAAIEESGLIGSRDAEFLWQTLSNNGSRHAYQPTLETLSRLMDVLEEVLHAAYIRRNERPIAAPSAVSRRTDGA